MARNEYSSFLAKQARKYKISVRPVDPDWNFIELNKKGKTFLAGGGVIVNSSGAAAFQMSKSKYNTHYYLKKHGYSVLPQVRVETFKGAEAFFNKHKAVVVKPTTQKKGKGITINVTNKTQLRDAWRFASQYGKKNIIEKYFPANDYRVLVINYTKVFVSKRIPAHVVGDGRSTIQKLINKKNGQNWKGRRFVGIEVDDSLRFFLKQQRKSLQTVPQKDEVVYLRGTANIHTGGEAVNFTKEIKPSIKNEAKRLARELGMRVVGIDYLMDEEQKKRYIIELNGDPGIQLHHFPTWGDGEDPSKAFLEMLFGRLKD